MTEPRLILVGSELEARLLAGCKALTRDVHSYRNWTECLAALNDGVPAVVIGALAADSSVDKLLLQRLRQNVAPTVILLASDEQMDRALLLFQQGAFEYLPLGSETESLLAVLQQALRRKQPMPANPITEREMSGVLIGDSAAVYELQRALQQLSKVNVPVLIRGDQGTGKRLFARELHERRMLESSAVKGPLVSVNVSAIARTAIDVELFGLERTVQGQSQLVRAGRIEEANGGTLFLDEVADLPLDAQIRLAQLLADGHYHRVGGYGVCEANVRIIAATRHSLETLVRNGQFQPDLYHRLTVVQVHLPRLQDRREDIPALANYFLTQVANEMGVARKQLAPAVLPILQQYDWPGNVRQLENLCRRLAVMVPEDVIAPEQLPLEMRPELLIANEARSWEEGLRSWAEQALAAGHKDLLDFAQPVLERILLQAALKHTGGLKQEAALLLGWGRNTLTRKLRELSIEDSDDDEAA
ncbi:sigma 54-interacting transcriptional regulator [Permianibacter sp. IMCC34836]|uniref:sigma 54-interacting transcriptional regulator n=1 Tax=Permianibacter fluminis TaxID=2738515 RepID=UPI001557B4ED|nr:sigma 54-interacting transcriptional regulator [Permianibacter fluminis]NQD37491.1 sigma 54-interacting transcriptional regulator [Permianibacter fluminis]